MIRTGSLFSQILSTIDRKRFEKLVYQEGAEHRAKGFRSWDQFVSMLFCQLAQARSLREIVGGLECCEGKLKHLGMAAVPRRSTLSYANAHRPWKLFEKVFYELLGQCQALAPSKKFRFKNKLMSLDSTAVELCLSVFDWAKYSKTKGALKLHLLLDHDGYLPIFAQVSDGKKADVSWAQELHLPKGSVVVMDRGYTDYGLYERWSQQGVFFVTRLKANANYWVLRTLQQTPQSKIRKDQLIELQPLHGSYDRKCRQKLRRIEVWLEDKQQTLVLLTNLLEFGPTTIAAIYKDRWQIELFFKALKQQLKIKTFVGTSANAVRIQIWTALIAILLLKYLQFRSCLNWALSNLVALLRWNLFTYRDLWRWIDQPFQTPQQPPPLGQLNLTLDSIAPT